MASSAALLEPWLERVLTAGILAPSADNHHLFRFSIAGDRICMKAANAYALGSAQTRLLAWISYGAAVENITIEASRFGRASEITWFPSENSVCEIRLAVSDVIPDGLADAIRLRHTNRGFFSGPPLSHSEQTDIELQVARVQGARLIWLDAPDVRPRALRLIRIAETERFRHPRLHAELFSSLRFDAGYNATCDEGIPLGAAGIDLPARPFFQLMRHWPVMRVLNGLGIHNLVGLRAAYLPARLSPHIGVITAEGDLRSAAIQAGHALERLWLTATQMQLGLQPFAAPTLFAFPEFANVSARVREEVTATWARLSPDRRPVMAFRLGRAPAVSVRAGRPPLSHFYEVEPRS